MPAPPLPITIRRPVTTEPAPDSPHTAIIQAISKLTLYRLQDKARAEVTAGDIPKATYHLKSMATRLFAQGEGEFAKTVLLEAQNLEQQQTFSQEGAKQIKYGTRALMLPAGKPKP
jgi:Ca-activated chloride channel family protein